MWAAGQRVGVGADARVGRHPAGVVVGERLVQRGVAGVAGRGQAVEVVVGLRRSDAIGIDDAERFAAAVEGVCVDSNMIKNLDLRGAIIRMIGYALQSLART